MAAALFWAVMVLVIWFVWHTMRRVGDRSRQRICEQAWTAHITARWGGRVLSQPPAEWSDGQLAELIASADEYGCRDIARKLRRHQARLARR